jgi:hypothetical protein
VTIRGNTVTQSLGRALWIVRGFGPIIVTGNILHGYGNPVPSDAGPDTTLSWQFSDFGAGFVLGGVARTTAGACVEIANYGLPEEQLWDDPPPVYPTPRHVDPGQTQIFGGSVLVTANHARLEWQRKGGWAASVLVQSTGSVVFHDNVSEVVTHNQFTPIDTAVEVGDDWNFAMAVTYQESTSAFVITNVLIGGRASASLLGNRLIEGRWDAIFSAVVGHAALDVHPTLQAPVAASIAVANVGTHCIIGAQDDTSIKAANVEVHGFERVSGDTTYTCDDVVIDYAGETRVYIFIP